MNGKKRIIVTGATGFVGSRIVRKLIEKNYTVSVISRDKSLNWRLRDLRLKLDVVHINLLDSSLSKVVSKINPTHVFHLAAYGVSPDEEKENTMIDTNIQGTLNLINAIKDTKLALFINTGSSSEYGTHSKPMDEQTYLYPVNLYGVTKAAQTLLCSMSGIKYNIPIITFRLFSPFGPFEDKNRLIPYVILRAIDNKPLYLSSPDYVRDFIYIDDVAGAYVALINKDLPKGEIYNIGSGKQHSIKNVVDKVMKYTGSTSRVIWNSKPPQVRQTEPMRWEANILKVTNNIGWQPETEFGIALEKTIDWFKKNKALYH